MVPNILDSKMIGIETCETTMTTTMINEVNTMTPRQNDLVVKKMLVIFWCTSSELKIFMYILFFKIVNST